MLPDSIKWNSPDGIIEFGPWEFEKKTGYFLRKDTAPRESEWSQSVGFNFAIGFIVDEGMIAPRIFGSPFLLKYFFSLNTQLPQYDIEGSKRTIDNLIRLFDK